MGEVVREQSTGVAPWGYVIASRVAQAVGVPYVGDHERYAVARATTAARVTSVGSRGILERSTSAWSDAMGRTGVLLDTARVIGCADRPDHFACNGLALA